MEQTRSINIQYLFRAVILTALAWYIVKLVKSEHLIYYIAPRMEMYVKIAAIAFQAMGVYIGLRAFRPLWETEQACDCGHDEPRSSFGRFLIYGLFALPLLLGFLLPDTLMQSNMAAKKGVSLTTTASAKKPAAQTAGYATPAPATSTNPASAITQTLAAGNTTSSALTAEDEALKKLFPVDIYNEDFAKLGMKLYKKDQIQVPEQGFLEIVQSVDMFMDNFIGKKIEISGFVYRESDMKPDQFVIARFGISCCSADATPFGLMVESAIGKNYAEDSWVKISGTIGKTTYNSNEIMKINALKIEKIPAPKSPYVYPDYDIYTKEL